jgi:glycosyltransferase involved in cell wall biosynthesis
LKKRQISFRILIGGKGTQEKFLRSLVSENNLEKEIEFLGFFENPKDLLMCADIFLLPSLWEGFGYVVVEAFLSCLPVIAFDTSSNAELIDKSTGFLTEPHKVKPFSDKIEYLYLNPRERVAIGKAGQAFVRKNFDSKLIFQCIEEYLLS